MDKNERQLARAGSAILISGRPSGRPYMLTEIRKPKELDKEIKLWITNQSKDRSWGYP